jgi:hypothetical protein
MSKPSVDGKGLISLGIILCCCLLVSFTPQAHGRWLVRAWLIFLLLVSLASAVWSWVR